MHLEAKAKFDQWCMLHAQAHLEQRLSSGQCLSACIPNDAPALPTSRAPAALRCAACMHALHKCSI